MLVFVCACVHLRYFLQITTVTTTLAEIDVMLLSVWVCAILCCLYVELSTVNRVCSNLKSDLSIARLTSDGWRKRKTESGNCISVICCKPCGLARKMRNSLCKHTYIRSLTHIVSVRGMPSSILHILI